MGEVGINLPEDLKAEYLLLQGFYEDYDKRALSLKALSVPLLGAGLAVGLKEGGATVLWITVAVAAALWLLEATWKSFQYRHRRRIYQIERCYRSGRLKSAAPPFQIASSWRLAGKYYRRSPLAWLRILAQPFVMLPYVVILLAAVIGLVSLASRPEALIHSTNTKMARPHTRVEGAAGPENRITAVPNPSGGFGNSAATRAPKERSEDADRPGSSPLLTTTLILLPATLLVALAYLLLRRTRSERTSADDSNSKAVLSPTIAGVGVVSAIMAFFAALTPVSKLGQSWWIAAPILVAPLVTYFAARNPGTARFRWWMLGLSLVFSIGLVCAFLIPSTVRGEPQLWFEELGKHFAMATRTWKSADFIQMLAAIFTYVLALVGGATALSKPRAGSSDAARPSPDGH